jgi:high-affinity nickel-transport protein
VAPLVSAALLGFVLGLQHATDPDHLVAVATIATRERRFTAGARVGLFWGIGHALTLGVTGSVLFAVGGAVPVRVATGLELLVAAMLVLLGALRLREAVRGILTAPPAERVADHHHGSRVTVHEHDGRVHVHPSTALLGVWRADSRRTAARALLVGAVHGMAGTAAIALFVLATLDSALVAAAYLAVFGLGTLVGMTALTAALAYPATHLARWRRVRETMAVVSGLAAIVFGCWYAARLV